MLRWFGGERIVYLTNFAGTTGYPQAKKWIPTTHDFWKLTQNVSKTKIQDLKL